VLLSCWCRAGSEEDSTDPSFVCERVCTSNRLLRRMGGLAKDPTPGTCVTVCGVGCAPRRTATLGLLSLVSLLPASAALCSRPGLSPGTGRPKHWPSKLCEALPGSS